MAFTHDWAHSSRGSGIDAVVADGVVQTVRSIINPDKLRHLGPLADVRALQHERSRGQR